MRAHEESIDSCERVPVLQRLCMSAADSAVRPDRRGLIRHSQEIPSSSRLGAPLPSTSLDHDERASSAYQVPTLRRRDGLADSGCRHNSYTGP